MTPTTSSTPANSQPIVYSENRQWRAPGSICIWTKQR
nr:MAG TPA: hypothetical protein [Caudoviricetes sp.]